MTRRKNMTAGQRQSVLESKIERQEMAAKFTQMLFQQMSNSISRIDETTHGLTKMQQNLQYSFLALREMLGVDVDALEKKAEELQIKDFDEASDKEDKEKGYVVVDIVEEDSLVLISSTTDDNKQNILRSRLLVSEIGFPQFKKDILGKKVGDVVDADINGTLHHIAILGVRKPPEQKKEEEKEVVDFAKAKKTQQTQEATQAE